MAKVTDLSGIRQLLLPLEESGTLIRRTDEEVGLFHSDIVSNRPCYFIIKFSSLMT